MLPTVYLRTSILLLVFLLTACSQKQEEESLPYYNSADFTPLFFQTKQEADAKVKHTLKTFSFLDQDRNTITDKNIEGKIHVANFVFTSCGNICPVMTEQMGRVSKAFQNDKSVVILSYSVTPWIDTPEKLKAYKTGKGIKNVNWHFLTGDKASIYSLARTSYFAEESLGFTKDSTQFLHTEHFVLVDSSKRIRGIYNGTLQLEAEQLIKDIKKLKEEEVL